MTAPTQKQGLLNGNGKWLAALLTTFLLSFGGGRFSAPTAHECPTAEMSERIASLETSRKAMVQRLDRIEHKLDRLLERKE